MRRIGIVKESAPGERRVAITPDSVAHLRAAGLEVLVETRAGEAAFFPDSMYGQAGAEIVDADELYARADIVACVDRPPAARLRPGTFVVGLLRPDPAYLAELAARGVTAASLDRVPRTISAAQPMDAVTSQENVAGYRAAVVAAHAYERFFPLLVTAAGTARPAKVLVLGAGVAGLAAIGTARRLGAVVTGYDVRPAAREEIASLGANVLDLHGEGGEGEGGYARAQTDEQQQAEQDELAAQIGRQDVVITTARVPGRRPPLLVTEAAVKQLRPGSVIVDLAAGPLGGNVEGSRPDETVVTGDGVTVIGAGNLPATMPAAASTAYAHNVRAFLGHVLRDGELALDPADEIQRAVIVAGLPGGAA
ncbi:NAD(P) transhydrogenase subunit alpha [Actinomadura sp. ATCC 31491]|uniref:proton-translocating NAD(P)(+) transhydrogenase n=1 Tax=Actinomadura luzonensis TaxID=2805427 RepID=A0ABT0FU97_9ACTN|nr:NAD(P) transhydrogenase subunit alpha [Actinomadura luzonensis]MCK2215887.1 NAD(P) transhydrogenase subunit alpha [Actinomadura luzonensis]